MRTMIIIVMNGASRLWADRLLQQHQMSCFCEIDMTKKKDRIDWLPSSGAERHMERECDPWRTVRWWKGEVTVDRKGESKREIGHSGASVGWRTQLAVEMTCTKRTIFWPNMKFIVLFYYIILHIILYYYKFL